MYCHCFTATSANCRNQSIVRSTARALHHYYFITIIILGRSIITKKGSQVKESTDSASTTIEEDSECNKGILQLLYHAHVSRRKENQPHSN